MRTSVLLFCVLGCLRAQDPQLKERPAPPANSIQIESGTHLLLSMINSVKHEAIGGGRPHLFGDSLSGDGERQDGGAAGKLGDRNGDRSDSSETRIEGQRRDRSAFRFAHAAQWSEPQLSLEHRGFRRNEQRHFRP